MSLIQSFVLEADTRAQLCHALSIMMEWHSSVSHFITGKDLSGTPYLALLWHGTPKDAQSLIAPIKKPEPLADQVLSWLGTVEYGREPDHDGSNHRGYRLTNKAPKLFANEWQVPEWSFYAAAVVQPCWIEYHK